MTDQVAERLHGIPAVMARLDLGRNYVFDLITTGELRSIKVGRRRLVSESALVEFITKLDRQGGLEEPRDNDPEPEPAQRYPSSLFANTPPPNNTPPPDNSSPPNNSP
jgi:excisionase family DNA binding protein